MAMASNTRHAGLRRATRKQKKSYREVDTDSESDFGTPPPKRFLPIRASRHLQAAYDDDIPSETSNDSENQVLPSPPEPRARANVPAKRKADTAGSVKTNAFAEYKRRKSVPTVMRQTQVKPKTQPGITHLIPSRSGRVPPWQTLPYHVLLKIMQDVAYPFYTGASRDTGSFLWLLNTSELCKSFHEACIGALMYSPPLFPAHRAHWLIDLLKASARDYGDGIDIDDTHQKRISLDYRTKVKVLDIEVKQILVKKAGVDVSDLLQHTPLLKDLRLYHNHDALADKYIWAHPSHSRAKDRWSYGPLFDTLKHSDIQLRGFEWNGRFLKDDPDLERFFDAQSYKSMQSLRSLTLRNLILPKVEKHNDDVIGTQIMNVDQGENSDVRRLASWRRTVLKAINHLPELEELSLQTCNIFDDKIIAELPRDLTKLVVSDCPFVKSEGLQEYLTEAGSKLAHLAIRGNQSLSLGWMSNLRTTTPRLQHLDIDLTYHDITSFRDTEPLFDDLLPNGSPTWPSKLEDIFIGPLRTLSAADAEGFYQSLVDAANDLPYLRVLQLRTFLNEVGWRDRAAMRTKWDTQLKAVFDVQYNPDITAPSTPEPEQQAAAGRKSRRLKNSGSHDLQRMYNFHPDGVTRQGRCHTVLFELSDQRPAQDQFREADFLDDEPEDDKEWDGHDDNDQPKYSARRYAW